jgi:STE24 endopeptidase
MTTVLSTVSSWCKLPWHPIYTQLTPSFSFLKNNSNKYNNTDPYQTISSDDVFGYYSFAATILFTVLVFSMEHYLDSRQKLSYQKTEFPSELAITVQNIDMERAKSSKNNTTKNNGENKAASSTAETTTTTATTDPDQPLLPQLQAKFARAQAYGLDKINFGMISSFFDTGMALTLLLLGDMPFLWDMSLYIGKTYLTSLSSSSSLLWTETTHEIYTTLIMLLLSTIMGTITSLPFELYSTFQIEKKHGFNKQTLSLFFSDKIKGLGLTMLIGGPFMSLLLYIIKQGGPYFHLYVWAFMFVFSIIMMTIVPVFIMPLFNKYEPLPDGTLKTEIYALASRLKYPLTKLYVMDGSKRSSHSNAFMFGFGSNKRIVLFDTLLTQVHEDEILAILGHELGHWKLGHTLQSFVVTQAYFGMAFYVFSIVYQGSPSLYAAFGFNDPSRPVPTIIALLLFFQTIWAPVDKILSFILTVNSRRNEFAADRFSVDLGMSKKLQSGLCKIHLENLGAMGPDSLYSMYHYSHPPLVERLSAMMILDNDKKHN